MACLANSRLQGIMTVTVANKGDTLGMLTPSLAILPLRGPLRGLVPPGVVTYGPALPSPGLVSLKHACRVRVCARISCFLLRHQLLHKYCESFSANDVTFHFSLSSTFTNVWGIFRDAESFPSLLWRYVHIDIVFI